MPGWGPTRAAKSWVHSVKPLRYLVWKAVVSVWAEGTLGRTSLLRIPQTGSFFSTCYSDHAGPARQILSRFEAVCNFYDFPGRKPLKYYPDVAQRAFVAGFRSFFAWGSRVGPTRAAKSWVHFVKPPRYLVWKVVVSVWAEGTLSRTSLLRICQTGSFFSRATVTMQDTHAKFCRVSRI